LRLERGIKQGFGRSVPVPFIIVHTGEIILSNAKSRFQLKLTCALILFAMLVSTLLATSDHLRMRNQAIANTEKQIELYEASVRRALDTVDKAYFLFGENIAERMKEVSGALIRKYEANPNPGNWNLERLKTVYRFDLYFIGEDNRITHSSYAPDVGLDFDECCSKLAKVLDERRADGGFYDDGIDIEQYSGRLKKYSYQATKDRKYVIQLGYSLEGNAIFREFDFFETIDRLIQSNPSINDIRVLNIGGRSLNASGDGEALEGRRKQAFEATYASGRTTEFRETREGESAVYRYVRHESKYDGGSTKIKVLEIVYNEKDLDDMLAVNTRAFLYQLLAILVIAAGLSLLIARWVARPMYLAFHDSLTGLRNRAAFEDDIRARLAANGGTLGVLMIDLDNFKAVNDRYGHDAGDRLLREVANGIRSAGGRADTAYRLGGDEFMMLLPMTTPEDAAATAARVLSATRRAISGESDAAGEDITVSVGIALAPEHGNEPYALCRNADAALYESKERGKNTYCVFGSERKP